MESFDSKTAKTMFLDSSFAVDLDDGLGTWKLKPGKKLEVVLCNQCGNIIEFSIPYLKVESYIDLRDETIDKALRQQISIELSAYALEDDAKMTSKAIELKNKLLELFEQAS